ncbi:AraC family ligand binding domain-containing protein [Nocardia sp. NPDC019395]|uniref:AraC family ligand binding domain-containing protein n=1 Tax=Nocardia sp. NPDC019395 TaxID=3154686 RepID=UPI00340F7690
MPQNYSEHVYGKVVNFYDLEQEDVRPGVVRSGYATDEVMLVMNVLKKDMQLRPHVHEDFDQLAVVTRGEANYYIGDVAHHMVEGSVLLVPAGSYHYIEPLSDEVHNLDLFCPPRGDYAHLLDYLAQGDPA